MSELEKRTWGGDGEEELFIEPKDRDYRSLEDLFEDSTLDEKMLILGSFVSTSVDIGLYWSAVLDDLLLIIEASIKRQELAKINEIKNFVQSIFEKIISNYKSNEEPDLNLYAELIDEKNQSFS